MAAYPPGDCCISGVKHEGSTEGKLETIAGYESYIANPDADKKHNGVGVLFLTDVFGAKFKNSQLLADDFARNGYYTVVPDIVFDDPVPLERPEGFDLSDWLAGKAPSGKVPHGPEAVYPVVEKVAKWMKSEGGCKKVAALGYCYGAKYVVHLLGNGQIDVGFVAHPSFVEKEQLQAIKGPLSIAAAETDSIFPEDKRYESEQILRSLTPKIPYQINLYSGVQHGFAVRGDLSQPEVKFGKEQAFFQAIQWLNQWLLK